MAAPDSIDINPTPDPGWKGGFSTSNPAFAYPNPDLSSLPLLCNMDNISRLTRQVHVWWPEFSWETVVGDPTSRCYERFAPDISRAGYDNMGRVWSIICPQQGSYSPILGSLNIEVTVTGQRGWVDETVSDRDYDLLAADMNVVGKIWFSPSTKNTIVYDILKDILEKEGPFPLDKAHAIQVVLHKVGSPSDPTIAVRSGIDKSFDNPDFALHYTEAWGVANVAVAIGPVVKCGNPAVDDFNAIVMDIFNLASGNILQAGNTLTWNVWFDAPSVVDQTEWAEHAEKWRKSIDTGHGYPDGPSTQPCYFNGSVFHPAEAALEELLNAIKKWLENHFPHLPIASLMDAPTESLLTRTQTSGDSPSASAGQG